ncbi:hypothetical protein KXQ82_04915 [Mucilaginibacter sp. HMF5004]|uniref:DUF5703 domain-containing protein n=1 Tax=Mucilaginibacter rivuli TaxID=2857527 RepID=UPI001C5D4B4B|nr:DUF5703 domain-containing protein [Mucilaginibacter rivuli]MBW4889041.1 hypothetical protein [Mucilaginibacter rivuli]
MRSRRAILLLAFILASSRLFAQTELGRYNVTWTSQSKSSAESMPCGGGDIGLNVWVENGDLLIYLSKSGTFDENNTMLKLGRLRVKLSPNPFAGKDFKQELVLHDGCINITGADGKLSASVNIWVDVFQPVVHLSIKSNQPITTQAAYESWRYRDRQMKGKENNQSSWKFAASPITTTYSDSVSFAGNTVQFYHHNRDSTMFDATVNEQFMQSVKGQMFNPLKNLTFGGSLSGDNMVASGNATGTYAGTDFKAWQLKSAKPVNQQQLQVCLYTQQTPNVKTWRLGLNKVIQKAKTAATANKRTLNWWHQYWQRSFVNIHPGKVQPDNEPWQVGRNYQLFRYMLGCNAYGQYPTKFNGGLFTYDPVLMDTTFKFTPDFRNWGGGLMTAQNQRLVYFPMIKNGDGDMMKPQFDFYLRSLGNAELRSRFYWNHAGANFVEQLENFGLPNYAEYGKKRPAGFDKGMEYNKWLEYEWDTVFQFCLMMLDVQQYSGKDIHQYIPFIESCLTFYKEHYEYLAHQRGEKPLDTNGHLILYPGSAAETFKMARNSTSTIAALQTILSRILELPNGYLNAASKAKWRTMLSQIPPISLAEFKGKQTIAPAKSWERLNNTESPQLYPVFPWHIYGVGKTALQTAINTYQLDTNAVKFRSHVGWKQDNIFAADLGLTDEAARLTTLKLKDSGRRFPAFWGPGFDWTPDHNWGGSGMIGLQEMLLQTNGRKIILFPAWPKTWDAHFKFHAPYQTTVEGTVKNGKVTDLKITPKNRMKDVVNMLNKL